MEIKEKIGCIADDFTGASDVCSFLIDSGASCIIYNEVPKDIKSIDADVIVVALKIRTIPVKDAIAEVSKAMDWFDSIGVTKIFDKYCSTFDSTSEGNIGPILDYLLERYNQKYTIVSPALPENRREVFNGYLFADGVLLNESSMRNHPLTPMLDSYIPRLLSKQSKYNCYSLNYKQLNLSFEDLSKLIEKYSKEKRFYICPDYFDINHGEIIMKKFGGLKILSGSSKLINDWYNLLFTSKQKRIEYFDNSGDKTLILSGSLSDQTNIQIKNFIKNGKKAININKKDLKRPEKYLDFFMNSEADMLFYSSRDDETNLGMDGSNAEEIEDFFAKLAKSAIEKGVKKLIVAGGETSGAVIRKLGYDSFVASINIAPGVPVLRPVEKKELQIVLKSGNFGQDNFFERAIELMG